MCPVATLAKELEARRRRFEREAEKPLGPDGGFRPTGVLVQRWVQNQLQRGAEHLPLRARAAEKNAAFELLEADFKAFVSEINLGVDLTWY